MQGVSTQILSDGTRYRLPRRTLGAFRFLGLALVLVICMFGAGAGAITGSIGASFATWGGPVGAAAGLLVVLIGARLPIRLGLATWLGRAELTLSNDRIECIERLPIGRWRRRCPLRGLRSLELAGGAPAINVRPISTGPLADIWGLSARTARKKTALVLGYPRAMLEPLAQEVAEHVRRSGLAEPGFTLTTGTDTDTDAPDPDQIPAPPGADPTPGQPPESRVRVTRAASELSLDVPPMGLVRGSKGLFVFAVVWNVFILIIGAGAFAAAASKPAPIGELGLLALFLVPFIAVGVFITLHSISMGRRRAVLDVIGDGLVITRRSPFSSSAQTLYAQQIVSITVGPSGIEQNDVPIMELQIRHKPDAGSEEKIGMLSQLPNEELEWVAAELNAMLRPGAASTTSDAA